MGQTNVNAAVQTQSEETQRLRSLLNYDILDTPPEAIFDELARMAASICDVPIALVSFVDEMRQWFKATVGLVISETPREFAFCAQAIKSAEPFIVPNTLLDPRFADNPLVTGKPHIRFYAGAPLIAADGRALGTLCVIDNVARELSPERVEALQLLAKHVMAHLELRKRLAEVSSSNAQKREVIRGLKGSRAELDELIQDQQARILQMVQFNALTGLANRSLFLTRLRSALQAAHVARTPAVALVMDIERFHLVAEAVGQSHLDELLEQVASRMHHVFDKPNSIAHLETDRFAAFRVSVSLPDTLPGWIESVLLPALSQPYRVGGEEVRISFKVGAALLQDPAIPAELLLKRAKTALAKAKESREAYALFSAELEVRLATIVTLESKLRRAIELEEFELHYQPKQSLLDGSVTGVEALIRWRDPECHNHLAESGDQWVPPSRFVPALESTGLILTVGRWALERAAWDYQDWTSRGLTAPRIAVNVSPLQLRHPGFLSDIQEIFRRSENPNGIDLELTEAILLDHPEQCIATLQSLRAMGVKIAIDDFGSGYSSLRYIARLPVDVLKIDMAFIHAMPKSPDNMAIVSSVISLAHGLRLKTVAEGVESEEQRNLLRLLRCDEIQGYLFSKPLTKPQLEHFIASCS
jgi:diguanylate cyclase (GGDEF)-like protein